MSKQDIIEEMTRRFSSDGEIRPGDIVQLCPEKTKNPMFAACMMTVTEVKSWGVQGYVQGLGENGKPCVGQAYYRAEIGTFERTGGRAVWDVNHD